MLTGGQTHDCTPGLSLCSATAALRPYWRTKGYGTDLILNHLGDRGINAVIPPRSMRKVQPNFDRILYRQHNRIERTFAHLKQFRRLATRFDKLKQNFHATVATACSLRWLRQYVDTP